MIKTNLGLRKKKVDGPDPIFIDRERLLTFEHGANRSQEQKDKATRTLQRMLAHLFCLTKPQGNLYQVRSTGKQGFNGLSSILLFAVNKGIRPSSKQDIM